MKQFLNSTTAPRRRGWLTALLTLGVMLGFCACRTEHQPYREAEIEQPHGSNYYFTDIEFDDQGMFWKRLQFEKALDAIRSIDDSNNVILVIFVHGWKHDASDRSGNRTNFHNFVTTFASVLNPEGHPPTNQVVGVYLGWRGDLVRHEQFPYSWTCEPLQTLGYWNRRDTARRVSGISATEAILSLVGRVREKPSNRAVVVGHSMGGLIVERAVTQVMVGSRLINAGAIQKLSREGDMGVLKQEWKAAADAAKRAEEKVTAQEGVIEDLENRRSGDQEVVEAKTKINTTLDGKLRKDIKQAAKKWDALRTDKDTRSLVGTNLDDVLQASDFVSPDLAELVKSLGEVRQALAPPELARRIGTAAASNKDVQKSVAAFLKEAEDVEKDAKGFTNAQTNLVHAVVKKEGSEPQIKQAKDRLSELKQAAADTNVIVVRTEANYTRGLTNISHVLSLFEKPPADLVLLVNPASEALIARKTIDAFQSNPVLRETGDLNQKADITSYDQPWIISVSSRGDSATRTIFPLAESVTAFWQRFQPDTNYQQHPVMSVSHKGLAGGATAEMWESALVTQSAPQHAGIISHYATNVGTHLAITNLSLLISNNLHHANKFEVVGEKETFVLTNHIANRLSSYWVVQVPDQLLPDHNEFFQNNFYALATSLYRMAVEQRKDTNSTTTVKPENAPRHKPILSSQRAN